jgi:hypothetical protein
LERLDSEDVISGTGSDTIIVFLKNTNLWIDKEVTLELTYLDSSSSITNLYNVVYVGLFCLSGSWMKELILIV